MRLLSFTVNAAFQDSVPRASTAVLLDTIGNMLEDAEVFMITNESEREIDHPDPDPEATPDEHEPWQQTARRLISAPKNGAKTSKSSPITKALKQGLADARKGRDRQRGSYAKLNKAGELEAYHDGYDRGERERQQ